MILNVILLVCMLVYLAIQSFFDVFNQCRTPAFLNHTIMGITFAGYVVKCIQTGVLFGIRMWVFFGFLTIDILIYLYCKKKNIYVKGTPTAVTLVSQQLLSYSPYALLLMITLCLIDIPMGLAFGVIWFLSAAKLYGEADRDAFWAMMFYYAIFGKEVPETNLLFILLMYLIACVIFMIRHKAWKIKDKVERYAFFPYIMIGFIVTIIIGGLSYGRI